MTDTGPERLRRFLDHESAEGVGGDDTPVYDVVGMDLTYGDLRETLAGSDASDQWRAAFENLHARILRDLPGDGSEIPQPDDPYWARTLDELAAFADQLNPESGTETAS